MTYLDIIKKSCNDIIIKNNDKERYLNEKSVQMKLAFDIWKEKNIEPELEKCFNYKSIDKTYTDIFIKDKIKIGVEIKSSGSFSADKMLGRNLAITTGYLVKYGDLKVQIRVENRTLRNMEGIVLDPWLPEGFEAIRLPFVQNLGPGQKCHLDVDILNIGNNS